MQLKLIELTLMQLKLIELKLMQLMNREGGAM